MYRRVTSLFVLAAAASVALAAPSVDIWFGTSSTDSTRLTNKLIGIEGTDFTTSVWMQTFDGPAPVAINHFAVQLFLSVDRMQGGARLDNQIGLNLATAAAGRNPVYTFFGGLAEKTGPGAGAQPWGLDAFMAKADTSGSLEIDGSTSPVWLADFRFTNLGLGYMESYTLRLENMEWDGSYFAPVTGSILYDDIAAELRVTNPVPEPATIIALGLGAAALIRRRRK